MQNFPIKKGWLITIAILLLLSFLNPRMSNFKDYKGYNSYKGIRKADNFLVFSIFKDEAANETYIGTALNFFKIKSAAPAGPIADSTAAVTEDTIEGYDGARIFIVKNSGKTYNEAEIKRMGYSDNEIREAVYSGGLVLMDFSTTPITPKMQLWDGMASRAIDTSNYEHFLEIYKTSEKVDLLFNGLKLDGVYKKGKNDFYKEYFPELTH